MTLKFKPKDFAIDYPECNPERKAWAESGCYVAQKKFDEWLESQPKVYKNKKREAEKMKGTTYVGVWYDFDAGGNDSVAYLVEEIGDE